MIDRRTETNKTKQMSDDMVIQPVKTN